MEESATAAEARSPFVTSKVSLRAVLPPDAVTKPLDHVKRQLNSMLLKYDEDVGGVLLCYSHLHIEKGQEYARIVGEMPWLHVSLNIKFLVFKPAPDMILEGVVSKVLPTHINLLVLGLFNATVTAEDLSRSFAYSESRRLWLSGAGEALLVGARLSLAVQSFQELNGVINISAALAH